VAVNTFAPYILTSLMKKPKRLVFVSSGLHTGGNPDLQDITWARRKAYNDSTAYADSKLHNILLANAVAERWPDVSSNSLDPGWVPTKLGGRGAPGSLQAAVKTYCLLAEAPEKSGTYWGPSEREKKPQSGALEKGVWDKYMGICEEVTGVKWPSTT
jgi:NAD(P)-dependent dehydrogenase (short-subunit alcohol dehydrogenase family)